VTADETTGSELADLAQGCVRFVKEALGIELDFTGDTLPVLDHYVRSRAEAARDEVLALLAPAAGAYFGEVVRRSFGAVHWDAVGSDYRNHRLSFEPFTLSFNPIGTAVEVITGAEATDWNAHFTVSENTRAAVEQSLQNTAPVDERDYYTFSVRFEALQQIADLLGALQERSKKQAN